MTEENQISILVNMNTSNNLFNYLSKCPSDFFTSKNYNNGRTILHQILSMDLSELFISLLKYIYHTYPYDNTIKQILNQTDKSRVKLLHIASYRGNITIIKELIKHDQDIYETDINGSNVLHFAAKGNSSNSIIFFVEKYNFDIYCKDNEGNTPLHIASKYSQIDALNFLLMMMDNVNVVNYNGETPLHLALYSERTIVIQKLIKKGIDMSIKNNKKKSVIDIVDTDKNYIYFSEMLHGFHRYKDKNSDVNDWYNQYSFFVISIILFSTTILNLYLDNFQKTNLLVSECFSYSLLIMTFFHLSFSDPGIVVSKNLGESWLKKVERGDKITDMCPYCKLRKDFNTKHCHNCGYCICNFDHHCNWVGRCIGKKNRRLFMTFLFVILWNCSLNYYISISIYCSQTIQNNYITCLCVFTMSMTLIFSAPVLYLFYIQIKQCI